MTDSRLKMLSYRAWRRGFREADLILGPFADTHLHGFGPAQLDAFEVLLDQSDPDLYDWILCKTPAPPALDGEVLELIRQFRFNLPAARGDALGA